MQVSQTDMTEKESQMLPSGRQEAAAHIQVQASYEARSLINMRRKLGQSTAALCGS